MVVVAQLVRALDCGSRGRRFETGLPPKKKVALCNLFLLPRVFHKRQIQTNISFDHCC